MKNRIMAIVSLFLFVLLLLNIFVFKKFEEFTVSTYAVIIIVFLVFVNRKDTSEKDDKIDTEKNYISSKKYLYTLGNHTIAIPAKYIENLDEKNLVHLV